MNDLPENDSTQVLAARIEALLFLSPQPVSAMALADACETELEAINEAVDRLEDAAGTRESRNDPEGGWAEG